MTNFNNSSVSDWFNQLKGYVSHDELLRCVESTSSTMELAKDLLHVAKQLPAPVVGLAIAKSQTNGRGRLDRKWDSMTGNCLATVVLEPNQLPYPTNLKRLQGFSLAVGLTIAELLNEHSIKVKLKWPNDILSLDNLKIGGILTEINQINSRIFILVGIGFNLLSAPAYGCCLKDLNAPEELIKSPPHFIAKLLPYLIVKHEEFQSNGVRGIKSEWLSYSGLISGSSKLIINYNNKESLALFVDLNESSGALIVKHNGETLEISACDVLH